MGATCRVGTDLGVPGLRRPVTGQATGLPLRDSPKAAII